jgi:hypothetical protein
MAVSLAASVQLDPFAIEWSFVHFLEFPEIVELDDTVQFDPFATEIKWQRLCLVHFKEFLEIANSTTPL